MFTTVSLTVRKATREEEVGVGLGVIHNPQPKAYTGRPSRHPSVGATSATATELETVNVVAVVSTYTSANNRYSVAFSTGCT